MSGGNLLLLDDSVCTEYKTAYGRYYKSPAAGSTEKGEEWNFYGVEAAKICHFYQETLTAIEETITSGLVEHLEIKCRPKNVSRVKGIVQGLDKKSKNLNSENVPLKPNFDKRKLKKFIEEESTEHVLYYLEEKTGKVSVVARDYKTCSEAVHKLKVHLGEIKPTTTGRQNRTLEQTPTVPARTYADRVKGDSSPTSSQFDSSWQGRQGGDSGRRHSGHSHAGSFSSGNNFSFEVFLGDQFKLKVYEAPITNLKVNVIVNADNGCLANGGGVVPVDSVAYAHADLKASLPGYGIMTIFKHLFCGIGTRENWEEWNYYDVDAAKICHFYQETLKVIEENIKREPSSGPVEHLEIKCRPKNDSRVEGIVQGLEIECKNLNSDRVPLKPNFAKRKLKEFIEEESTEHVLYYLEEKTGTVSVVARDYNTCSQAVHKLKVHLGEIKPTPHRRQNRTLEPTPTVQARTYTDRVKGDSSPTSSKFDSSSQGRQGGDSWRRHSGHSHAGSFSSGNKFSFEVSLGDQFKVKVYEASITNLKVNVIVNAANDCLAHGGGVARVIADAAGEELNWESRKHGNLRVSENCVTTAGHLDYRGVIHAVGPQWHDYREKEKCLDALYECIWKIFETCDRERYRTVAMSAISAGIYGVPKELCANMHVKAAVDYSNKSGRKYLRELHIVDVDVQILKLVQDSYQTWKKHPNYINQKNSISYYFKHNPTAALSGYSHHHSNSRGTQANRKIDSIDNKVKGAVTPVGLPKLPVQVEKQEDEQLSSVGVAQKFRVGKHLIVKIYQGAIQKVKNVDAIACGIDKWFTRTGYIVSALKIEGGSEYERALDKLQRDKHLLQPNDVKLCPGGNLDAFKVLHLVTERIQFASEKEIRNYEVGIMNILEKADDNDLEKIAIPLIGTGSIESNSPKLQICCKAFMEAICKYCGNNRTTTNVKELHLVNNNDTVYTTLRDIFDRASQSSVNTVSRDEDEEVDQVSGRVKTYTKRIDDVGRMSSGSVVHEDMETDDYEDLYSSIQSNSLPPDTLQLDSNSKDLTRDGGSSGKATGEEPGQAGNLKITFE